MVLAVSFVLSPVTGLSCHCRKRNAQALSPLDASVGASGPHDFAVRDKHDRQPCFSRPPHPVPRFVTIASRPSVWDGTAGDMDVIWVKREGKYFWQRGWTARLKNTRVQNARVYLTLPRLPHRVLSKCETPCRLYGRIKRTR